MHRLRASWLIIVAVVLLSLAVKPLRQQAVLPLAARTLFLEHPEALAERAAKLVKQRYPNDPEMLLGAGLLFIEKESALDLLRQAAEKGSAPAAWAAYYEALKDRAPEYMRLGNQGIDPSRPELVAGAKETMRLSDDPDRLDHKEVLPLIAALRSWAAADPENGLPLALQTDVLYGLHQDQKAFDLWQAAGSRPRVNGYSADNRRAVSKVLTRMGNLTPEVLLVAQGYQGYYDLGSYAALRQGARIAFYEGKLAQIQGRNADALRWWNSSITLGRKLEDTGDTMIWVLVGMTVKGYGASPAWEWYQDKTTGTPGGPLLGGRLWYGRDHAFFVGQVGEEKDAEIRDSLVRGKVRSQLLRRDTEGSMERFMSSPGMRGVALAVCGAWFAALGVLHLLSFLVLGTWRRKQADEAGTFLRPWQVLDAVAGLLPFAVLAVVLYRGSLGGTAWPLFDATAIAVLVGALVIAVAIPVAALRMGRLPGSRLRAGWRGNLRAQCPVAAALCALTFLALSLAALKLRAEWVRQWSDPKMTEMAQVRQRLGAKWEKPEIPKDAWRAEYPKLIGQ